MDKRKMIPVGYEYKTVALTTKLGWSFAEQIKDVYSVSNCISRGFTKDTDYIKYWKHNGFWFFDTPAPMKEIAASESIDISGMTLFYYEVYEEAYNDDAHIWEPIPIDNQSPAVILPKEKRLEGFDVVSGVPWATPQCSPLSCNGLTDTIPVNQHCLLETFDEAKNALENGLFTNSEPGPYRIFAVYTVLQFE